QRRTAVAYKGQWYASGWDGAGNDGHIYHGLPTYHRCDAGCQRGAEGIRRSSSNSEALTSDHEKQPDHDECPPKTRLFGNGCENKVGIGFRQIVLLSTRTDTNPGHASRSDRYKSARNLVSLAIVVQLRMDKRRQAPLTETVPE